MIGWPRHALSPCFGWRREEVREATERKRKRWQQALAGVFKDPWMGPGTINLFLLHAAVPHECLWEYRNATADLWSPCLLIPPT